MVITHFPLKSCCTPSICRGGRSRRGLYGNLPREVLLDAVMPNTKLQEHSGSEKAWVWSAVDFADEVQKPELFCIRFASVESESLHKLETFSLQPQGLCHLPCLEQFALSQEVCG